jgi:glycosyltransferase involved in cell wall biosynthesis
MKKIGLVIDNINIDSGNGIDRFSSKLDRLLVNRFIVNKITMSRKGHGLLSLLVDEFVFFLKIVLSSADIYMTLSTSYVKYIKIFKNKPIISFIHDLIPFEDSETVFYYKHSKTSFRRKLNLVYLRLNSFFASKSDYIIVPFEVTKNDVINRFDLTEDKVIVLNYAVDTSFFKKQTVIKHNYLYATKDPNLKIILFIGGFTLAKGADSAIKSIAMSSKEINVELWVVGRECSFDYVQLIKSFNIEQKVRYFGHVEDAELLELYNLSDLLLMPSRVGFSLQILEAGACGLPVICSDTQDIKELIGDFPMSFNPENHEQISNMIVNIFNDDDFRQELTLYCEGISNNHSLNRYFNDLENVFDVIKI